MRRHADGCLLCGAPLRYTAGAAWRNCALCGRTVLTNAACAAGHYVCDACHAAPAVPAILRICAASRERDPAALAGALMDSPAVHMHGPEHHVLTGAALLTAYHNCGGQVALEPGLQTVVKRGGQIPGGICGLWGACGAALGAGIFVSVATGATPMTAGPGWGLANRMTAACLEAVGAVGGPRCCKRTVFLTLRAAVPFTAEHLGVAMPLPAAVRCRHSGRNRECLGARCPFHG